MAYLKAKLCSFNGSNVTTWTRTNNRHICINCQEEMDLF